MPVLQANARFRGSATADYSTTSTTSGPTNWEPLDEARRRNQTSQPQNSHKYPQQRFNNTHRVTESRRTIHEEDEREDRESVQYKIIRHHRHYDRPSTASSVVENRDMSVDYSTQDFQRSRAVIDAASKQDNVRVKKIGDTTIISEHRYVSKFLNNFQKSTY